MKLKTLNYTITLQKEPEGGYTVTVPALPGCITYGKDVDEAKEMATEAISLYLDSLESHKEPIPIESNLLFTQVNIEKAYSH